LHITDPKLIQGLVLGPIKKAVRDPKPAEYIIIGDVTLINKDGSRYFYTLFAGWKNVCRGDEYWITDFGELQKAWKQALDRARFAVDSK